MISGNTAAARRWRLVAVGLALLLTVAASGQGAPLPAGTSVAATLPFAGFPPAPSPPAIPAWPAPPRSSPIALTPSGRLLVIVNPDSGSISLVETGSRSLVAEVPVGANPQAVAIAPTGRFAYVTLAGSYALAVVDLEQQQVTARLPVGVDPFGVVVGADGRVYVANTSSDTLSVWDAALTSAETIPVAPGPRGLALSPDGQWLYITHFRSGQLSRLDTRTMTVDRVLDTGPDSNWSQAVAVDATAGLAYMPMTRANNTGIAGQYDSTVLPTVAVVDLTAAANLRRRRIALDVADRPVNLPIDGALSGTGKLWVVNAGSNDVTVLDTATGFAVAHLDVGDNPRGIALTADGNTAYVNNVLGGTITVIDARRYKVTATVPVTAIPLPPNVLLGKRLFNNSARPELSRSGWMSCASCHFDNRSDGRVWPTSEGPRNTKALAGLDGTAPYHWSGNLDEIQDAEGFIRTAMAGQGLTNVPTRCTPACDQDLPHAGLSDDLDALAAFLLSVQDPPSPYRLPDGSLTAAAARGERLFSSQETGCAYCHTPPLFTNRRMYDVGTATDPREVAGPKMDTPSLRGLWRTAPYLHDGSAPTLIDVLTAANANGRHGRTSQLTPTELADLVEYLRSL